ncbi:hypothetical protein ccbrp13_48300 [Ktedonobacteria bacterium brp13]|nr:hypothetical protein ccbrp13_48300 [Ktedonobacteria bacterium brp13]
MRHRDIFISYYLPTACGCFEVGTALDVDVALIQYADVGATVGAALDVDVALIQYADVGATVGTALDVDVALIQYADVGATVGTAVSGAGAFVDVLVHIIGW